MGEGLDTLVEVRALIEREPLEPDGGGAAAGTSARLQRLCRAAARALPASGVGVSVMTDVGTQGVAAASDDTSEVLEELQFTLGEGPCLEAYATRRPVLVPALDEARGGGGSPGTAAARWPHYTSAVHGHGVRAVFAFPMQVGAARLGVMDVYRSSAGSLTARALGRALGFAEVAVTTLLDGQASAGPGEAAAGLDDALDDRLVLYQAQGMVMVQLGVSLTEAMARLRAHAYAGDRRLADVAADVVARRLVLEGDAE